MKRLILMSLAIMSLASAAAAQAPTAPPPRPVQGRMDALDPTPVNPATDPDVDQFINDWRNGAPRTMYSGLVLKDIFSPLQGGDPMRPQSRGGLLREMTAISQASIAEGAAASGRMAPGTRQSFYTTGGRGKITVGGKTYDIKEGAAFALRPAHGAFRIAPEAGQTLSFYVRSDAALPDPTPNEAFAIRDRFDADRRVGIHWSHVQSGGVPGMIFITLAPNTLPHPHSHLNEEVWLMVKGETLLSIGKTLRTMKAGEAVRIPPTGMTAHSSINLSDEPVQMIVMIASGGASPRDYAQLDSAALDADKHPDVGMYMGGWKETLPRIMHGNIYFRDMLTALNGADALHPTRKGAVLTKATAVSYAQLEPGAYAHPVGTELNGIQQTFVVQSGTGVISGGDKRFELGKGMSFILSPGLDFKLTATGDNSLNFYVVSEKLDGAAPRPGLTVVDNRDRPTVVNSWVNRERDLITKADGLAQYRAITSAQMEPRTMSRPYSVAPGGEEIWIATDGDVDLLLGKQLLKLPAGTAFAIPPSGLAAQAKLNLSGRPASFLYVAK